jgi:hypothetical protein
MNEWITRVGGHLAWAVLPVLCCLGIVTCTITVFLLTEEGLRVVTGLFGMQFVLTLILWGIDQYRLGRIEARTEYLEGLEAKLTRASVRTQRFMFPGDPGGIS